MTPDKKKRYILAALLGGAFLSLLFMNKSLRLTILRHRAIQDTEQELKTVSREIEQIKRGVANLESNPPTQEQLVRKELGYLRPGEKEIRFIKTSKKDQ